MAISLGVPIKQVEAWDTKPLGGLLALGYWRDGKSGDLFPPTWGFLLKMLKESKGPNVADALEKEVRSNPAWSIIIVLDNIVLFCKYGILLLSGHGKVL